MSSPPPVTPVTPSPPARMPPVTPSPPARMSPPVTPSPPARMPPVTPPPPVMSDPPPPAITPPPPAITPPPPVMSDPPPPAITPPPPRITPPPQVITPPPLANPPVITPPPLVSPPASPPMTSVTPPTQAATPAPTPTRARPPTRDEPTPGPTPGPSPMRTPTPVFPPPPPPPPSPPRPTPTPTPVTPSPSPPPPSPTPTPTPVTPSPPPSRPPPSASPPPPADVPGSSPPPPDVNPSPPDTLFSPPPPNDVPDMTSPPPSPLSLYPPPPPPQSGDAAPSKAGKSSSSSTTVGVGVAVGAVVLLGFAAVLIFCFVSKRRRRRRVQPPPVNPEDPRWAASTTEQSSSWVDDTHEPGTPVSPLKAMPGGTVGYDELAAATDGFSDANLLGQGGFGHVYKGTVLGQEVAIKKLRAGSGQGHREFRAEVDIISRVHHKNLVSLVGFCIHAEQRLLVYEYVPNKTLQYNLHSGSSRAALDWPRRWKIAVGSAKGLAYLHEDCHPKIIHRDIKAENILLDYNYEPKVADFGLAKCQELEQTTVASTRVMGTFGYLAPEYAATGKVTDRSDVYSFGVVLLELITGRKPVLKSTDDQPQTLADWAKPLLTKAMEEENYEELIDPRLESNYDAYDMARLVSCAAAAIRQTAKSRPRMSQIVRYLEGELSAEDLNAGMTPFQSSMHKTDEMRRLRRMAFGPGSGAGGGSTISEYASSEMSAPTSEYGLNPSSEYTASSAVDTEDMTDFPQRTTSGEVIPGTTVSRRTTFSRQAGRAGLG